MAGSTSGHCENLSTIVSISFLDFRPLAYEKNLFEGTEKGASENGNASCGVFLFVLAHIKHESKISLTIFAISCIQYR